MSFNSALNIQKCLARQHLDAVAAKKDYNDILIFVEHKPVYTVGKL